MIVCESRSLVLGPMDEDSLAQFILRIAFSEPADDGHSVLQSVLALASLQLHGKRDSFRYKRHAVASIAVEAVESLDEKMLLQNLMTAMLLYHYEVSKIKFTIPARSLINVFSFHSRHIQEMAG